MSTFFTQVGVLARKGNPQVAESVRAVVLAVQRHGLEPVADRATVALAEIEGLQGHPRSTLGTRCDLLIVVGGDGSILGVARDLAHAHIPVLGVNRGGLGFLAGVSPDQIDDKIAQVLSGEFSIEEHFLLHAEVRRGGEPFSSPALNDVVVHSGSMARMMSFSLWVNDQYVYEQRSDGVIVASPTGSTAYSLSAGGPIMHPSLDAVVIVPMFPHTLTSRPLVVPGDRTIRIVIGDTQSQKAEVSCDSQITAALAPGDEVIIRKFDHALRLMQPVDHSFYESCRSKLDWGTRLGDS